MKLWEKSKCLNSFRLVVRVFFFFTCLYSLVPRPVRTIRVTRGGLEPSAIAPTFPTSLTGDVTSEIAEDDWERGCCLYILTKTEQKKCKNTQKILLDLCYLLLRSICKKNIYMLFTGWEIRIGRNCARGLEYCSRPTGLQDFEDSARSQAQKKINVYVLKSCLEKGQRFQESLRRGRLVKNELSRNILTE